MKIRSDTRLLVFIHGWNGSQTSWNRNIPFFESHGFNCKAVTLPGHGGIPEPSLDWGIPEYSTHVYEQIQNEFGNIKFTAIGHSFGGRIAVYLSANYLENVVSLILTDAAGINIGSKHPRQIMRLFSISVSRFERYVNRPKLFFFLRKVGRNIIGSNDYKNSSPVMREILKRVVDLDLSYALPTIRQPCLVLWGEDDRITPLKIGKAFSRGIKNSRFILIQNAGHNSHIDEPDIWNQTVLQFLESSE